jgi:hypothetical protein
MPLINAPTCLLVVEGKVDIGLGQFRKVCNAFAYRATNATSVGPLNSLSDVFASVIWSGMRARFSTRWVGVQYWLLSPCHPLAVPVSGTAPPLSGTVTGPSLPLSLAVNIGLLSSSRGRHYQGVKRFSPIPASHVVGDELTPVALSGWNVLRGRFVNPLTDANGVIWQPCIFSRALSPALGPGYQPFMTDITGSRSNKTLGFARHRREPTRR